MKQLPIILTRKAVYYSQVKRSKRAALYALRYGPAGRIIGYDVFKVVCIGESVFRGKTMPPYEKFPADIDYGSTAFSYSTLEAACKKYNEIQGD